MEIAFWIYMLLCLLLIPGVMLVFGRSFSRRAPEEINPGYGYRSTRSMKNPDTWRFAHRYCGRVWYRAGLVLLPVSPAAQLAASLVLGWEVGTTGSIAIVILALQLAVMLSVIPLTERALKREFDDFGLRRQSGGKNCETAEK